jgi:glutathione S-transferase
MHSMIKLFYYPNNASLAPHFMLHALNLPYELVLVDRQNNCHQSSEYLAMNPSGRIPTLVDGDVTLFESAAICSYLCEKVESPALIPALGEPKRALYLQWLSFLNNTLQTELLIFYYPQRHTDDSNGATGVKSAQEKRIADVLTILDNHLADKAYMLGDKISVCDYFLFMLLEWSMAIKRSPMSFSHIAGFIQRMLRDPHIIAVCQMEQIDLGIFKSVK